MSDENPAQADDVRQMVYDVVRVWLDNTDAGRFTNEVTNAVLSVPALAEVFARDAQVREIVQSMRTATVQGDVWAVVGRLSALYPEVASMLRDGKGVDNSDIMPGSEFDGPVVL